jgi:ABC-type antimicrobial peptide transport system permease subunit
MMEIIALTGALIQGGKKLMENEAVAETVNGVFSWIGNALGGKKSVTETLEKVESGEVSEEEVNSIKNKLEFVLEDDEDLQKQLSEKLEEVKKVADREGVTMVTKTNTQNITGNNNISLQDINSGGNITIG